MRDEIILHPYLETNCETNSTEINNSFHKEKLTTETNPM